MNSICIVKRGKTLSLCGVNSFIFSFSFWLREVRIDLVRTSTILHTRLVHKIQPAPCYIPKFRYRAPKTSAFTTRTLLSRNYNARENSLQLPNPDTRNPPSNPEPKGPLVQIGGGYFCNTPYILDKRVPVMLHPLPSPPFRHSKSQAAITSPLQPRNPTLLRPPRHRCPAGASSPTTSSTTTA